MRSNLILLCAALAASPALAGSPVGYSNASAPAGGTLGWLPGDGYRYFPPLDWRGGRVDDDGQALLDPWLRDTPAGRRFVTWNYDADRNGIIDRGAAFRANQDFAAIADRDADGVLSDQEIRVGLLRIGAGRPWPSRAPGSASG